jgi:ABC-2 type transport system ATP-binding protein
METIIKTNRITKKYGSFAAVKSLNLSISKGEIYGFIGLNGAGKTTTIRMLLGMIKPTEGDVALFGQKISSLSTKIWSKVGFLVERATAYPQLTVEENLELSRKLYQIKDKKSVYEVMEKLNLVRYRKRKSKHLSHGNFQRLAVAKALLHKPQLLILDEPTNGMDPAGIVEIRNLLRSLSENDGVTIFISSHILGEIYRFTTRIGIIHEGVLIEEMDIESLKEKMQEKLVLDAADRPKLLSALKEQGLHPHINDSGEVEIADPSFIKNPENLAVELIKKDIPINKLNVEKEDLEEHFLNKVRRHESTT